MTMNCDHAAELLPWLLNGTLEAGERREVLDHLRGCPACRAALADTRIAWEIFDWHPEPAALISYAAATATATAASGDRVAGTSPAPAAGGGPAPGAGGGPAPATAPAAATAGGRDAAGAGDFATLEEHVAGCPRCAAELELVRTSRLLADPSEDERIAILPPRRPRQEDSGDARLATPAAAAFAPSAAAGRRRAQAGGRGDLPARAAVVDDAAARRAWQRSAMAAGLVGLLAITGWYQSARQSRDLERRLAVAAAKAPAAGTAAATAAASREEAASLKRRAGEAEARLSTLAGQNQQLQRQVAELGRTATDLGQRAAAAAAATKQRQPQPAPPIESDAWVGDLSPAGQAERGAGEPASEVIPLSSGTATLLLHARLAESSGDYQIEIRDARDRPVGKPIRVQPQPGSQGAAGEFGITLRRNALPPGAYTLHLVRLAAAPGAGEPARKQVASYSVRIS
jgi:hypothetical protein